MSDRGRWDEFNALRHALGEWRSVCWARYKKEYTGAENQDQWYSDMVARHEHIARMDPPLRKEL